MTYDFNSTTLQDVMNILSNNGFDGTLEIFKILMNEAMKAERSQALHAGPYERSDSREGYANGFKDKTLNTRLGKVTLDIPQVRGGVSFYPKSLSRGTRSEIALKTAIAERKCTYKAFLLEKYLRSWRNCVALRSPQLM